MDLFTKQRLTASIIALLIVLNIVSLGTLWFLQLKPAPLSGPKTPGSVKNFLTQELHLTLEQERQFEALRQEHFRDSKRINDEMRSFKEAIIEEIFAQSPDSAKVKTLAEEIGAKQTELEELRFQHFLALKSVCRPEQLEKFQGLFHELFPPLQPPTGGRPPQPGRAPRQGRGPGARLPREAIEACQGRAEGSSCQFAAPHGTVSGVCQSLEAQLVCVPENRGARKPPPSP